MLDSLQPYMFNNYLFKKKQNCDDEDPFGNHEHRNFEGMMEEISLRDFY